MNSMQQWIFGQRSLQPGARLMLLYYAARANGELTCFPSFTTVADACGLTRRYVIETTLKVLCAKGGPMTLVTNPSERTAILAKARAKDNCRSNVYRINFTSPARNGEVSSLSDGEVSSPSRANGEVSSPIERDLEAEALALCVPFGPDDGEVSSPIEGVDGEVSSLSDGEVSSPRLVNSVPVDGEVSSPELKELELKETELLSRAEALDGGASSVARTLKGAPAATPPAPKDDAAGAPGRATTIGGDAPSLPVLRYGPPPDPFDDAGETKAWLSRSLGRAVAAATPRPKAIYAPVAHLAAARADLARRAAERAAPEGGGT